MNFAFHSRSLKKIVEPAQKRKDVFEMVPRLKIVEDESSSPVFFTGLDYAKAFDKVSHRLLIMKLKGYGIDGKLLAWLTSYLENRK